MFGSNQHEKRRQCRHRKSGPVQWRARGESPFGTAWLLEASIDGLAFAWRGERAPQPGTVVEVRREPSLPDAPPQQAVIRRVSPVHDNLYVLGAEVVFLRPFPPSAAEAGADRPAPAEPRHAARRLAGFFECKPFLPGLCRAAAQIAG